jgi:putative ABC transport system permease protein
MGPPDRPWITIVGIVGDERHNGMTGLVKEKFYRPISQFHRSSSNPIRNVALVVKTEGQPLALAAPIRTLVRSLDANLPLAEVRTLDDIVSRAIATPRLTGFLLGTFAMLALMLASIGIYGVLAYAVAQRTHELGVRAALGASSSALLRLVLIRGLILALLGLVIGLGGTIGLTRFIATILFNIPPRDPMTLTWVAAVLAGVAMLACYIPARRATKVDPLVALRYE